MEIKKNLKYQESHEWLDLEGDIATVGVSDYAQSEMGDVVYVELPEVGQKVNVGDQFATIESVKAVFEIYSPVAGEVIEVNEALLDAPESINGDAFTAYIAKFKVTSVSDKLLTPDEYADICK